MNFERPIKRFLLSVASVSDAAIVLSGTDAQPTQQEMCRVFSSLEQRAIELLECINGPVYSAKQRRSARGEEC